MKIKNGSEIYFVSRSEKWFKFLVCLSDLFLVFLHTSNVTIFLQVSIFLKDKVQSASGKFVLTTDGLVPWETEVPGAIR